MTSSFGHRLRLQREERGVTLAAIAADTKIKLSLLEALERDDVSLWPGGIFRRAYLRSYAQAIGLDPEPVVREFLDLHPDPAEAAPDSEADAPPPPPNRLRRLVTSAIAAVPSLQTQRRPVNAPPASPAPREYVIQPDRLDMEDDALAVAPPAATGQVPSAGEPADVPLPAPNTEAEEEFVLVPPLACADDDPGPLTGPEPTLADAADLCTRIGRAANRNDLVPVLEDAARLLNAVGLVVWSWDGSAAALRPSLAYGYSDSVLARLPVVRQDAENAIGAAFRSAEPCTVQGDSETTGAAVFPLIGPSGCTGVLALELRDGGEQRASVRALASILAAQLVALLGSAPMAEVATA